MKLVVITLPDMVTGEENAINSLFESGLELLHLRKPKTCIEEVSSLIESIKPEFRRRITLHDNFELLERFDIGGLHINSRNRNVPCGFKGRISASCHSLSEVCDKKEKCDYVFLSPIFDSISKEGYDSNFTEQELSKASQEGIIDEKVYALGGIGLGEVLKLKEFPFGGIAVLGGLWKDFAFKTDVNEVLLRYKQFAQLCSD